MRALGRLVVLGTLGRHRASYRALKRALRRAEKRGWRARLARWERPL